MSDFFDPTEHGYDSSACDSEAERKKAWLDAADEFYDIVFGSGGEVRHFLRARGVDTERFVESARRDRKSGGWYYRVDTDFAEMNENPEEYREATDRMQELLSGTNAGVH